MGISNLICWRITALCLIVTFTSRVGLAQVPFANWDDYLEFFSSMRYCKDMVQEKEDYVECVYDLVDQSELKLKGDIFVQLCSNVHEYLNCWKPIVEKSRACNAGTGRGVPSAFKASIEIICGNDKGKSNKAKLESASKQEAETKQKLISSKRIFEIPCSGSKYHWVDACVHLEEGISSSNKCTRFAALSQCLGIIACKEKPVDKFYLDLYKQGARKLGC